MGNWITSTFLRFDTFLSAYKQRQYSSIEYHRRDQAANPSLSLRTAAEIVALQRMKTNHDDADSDFSDDEECPQMTVQEERRMFEREQQIAFSGRCTIGDPDSCKQLREYITARCGPGPSTSTTRILLNRDIARRSARPTTDRTEASIVNTFLPNRKKRVDKVPTKSFCAQYVQNGRMLVVASQDEKIRFYQKNTRKSKYTSRYFQCNELKADACSWSILDMAVSADGSLICYSTWRDQIFLGRLDGGKNQTMTWTPLALGELKQE
uniref:Uncharacterized protein n=1 Tax=Caenorhabditis japonica TaxID=281687 RepID=A0A8R1I9U7_CAEJA